MSAVNSYNRLMSAAVRGFATGVTDRRNGATS